MSARRRQRALAAIVGAAMLVGVGFAPSAQVTDAAFTDPEHASATFTATSVTPLTDATCQTLGTVSFTGVRLTWRSVYDMALISDPAYSPVSGTNSAGTTSYLNRASITKTGPTNGRYTYTATMSTSVLGGLLGTVLGASSTLTIQERYPLAGSVWVTPPIRFRLTVALGGLLGIGTSCTAI